MIVHDVFEWEGDGARGLTVLSWGMRTSFNVFSPFVACEMGSEGACSVVGAEAGDAGWK